MIERYLPAWLMAIGPYGLARWQWVAVPALLAAALAFGAVLSFLTRRVLAGFAAKTAAGGEGEVFEKLKGPLTALWALLLVGLAESSLDLGQRAAANYQRVTKAAVFLALLWGAFRAVNALFSAARQAPWARQNPSLAGILPLCRKISKFTLVAFGAVAVLNEFGFQVASLVAGLGIGGIALALAAQKTVENLFGSVAIGVDQPFRVGDFVKVEGVLGTVESIGMRSTRFRTPDRTLVTVPNGKLADMKAETFAVRDRCRLYVSVGLVYGTKAGQVRRVLSDIEGALRGHAKIWSEGVSVRFATFTDSALQVEVEAWFRTTNWEEFTLIRQELLLRFMEIVEEAGTSFALPTQRVLVEELRGKQRPGTENGN